MLSSLLLLTLHMSVFILREILLRRLSNLKGEQLVNRHEKVIPTGNEFISLPTIREADGAILSMNTLHMLRKGLVSFYGTDDLPFLMPYIEVDGTRTKFVNIKWSLLNNWIPVFTAAIEGNANLEIQGTILTHAGEKGFVYHF